MRGINHNNEETNLNSIKKQSNNLILTSNNMNNHNFALRKSSDSTLTKSSNNFFDKTSHKNEVESSLSDYILKKGGKIMNNMAQKKIFLTPKGAVIFFKISFVF